MITDYIAKLEEALETAKPNDLEEAAAASAVFMEYAAHAHLTAGVTRDDFMISVGMVWDRLVGRRVKVGTLN